MTIVVRGGGVVSTSGVTQADLVIEGEFISALLAPESETSKLAAAQADRVVDATGCYVLPGGVDAHVHLQLPMSPEATSSDTFSSGTAAAAWGGTCLLYTSPSPRDATLSRMPSSA